eukprot:CAMPEP_0198455200 /NCGR_PEP_ID=MMETSP1453-20131121/17754_1 /TAXON_ID=1461543 ORGANISM="Unidentified sp., Strain RCC701" /NCGR_SAMPLE_ID=MMETSP1453 /ASSEMBLY_ACC=CAM_ASM_001118 /LENGTH=37 /DNA_ID= /DNA_START= /DNA_END= /DNA_ORIENTATION=
MAVQGQHGFPVPMAVSTNRPQWPHWDYQTGMYAPMYN